MPVDVLALQELHIRDLPHWQSEASKANLHLSVPPLEQGSEHLVGYLVRTGTLHTIPLPDPLLPNCILVVAWHLDEGPPVLLANVFGFASPSGAQLAALGEVMLGFLDHCEAQQAPLIMLPGDFNVERQHMPNACWHELCRWGVHLRSGDLSCWSQPPSA